MSSPVFAIEHLLPHRHPFLFVDRMLTIDAGDTMRCSYRVPTNHPYLNRAHGAAVFPHSLLIEALGQTAALCIRLGMADSGAASTALGFLVRIDRCTFQHSVQAGEEILLEATRLASYGPLHKFETAATGPEGALASAALTLHVEV